MSDVSRILYSDHEGTVALDRRGFLAEERLQELLFRYPELLDAIASDVTFIPIAREVEVPIGRIDLVFVDSTGLTTLVETKLEANPESRRKVVGQILEYAAYASEWRLEDLDSFAETAMASPASPDAPQRALDRAAATRLGLDDDDERPARVEQLRADIGRSLAEGRLRIVVALDERVPSLERIVSYLSAHSDLEVVLLQVSRFEIGDGRLVLIPSVQGNTAKAVTRRPSVAGRTPHTFESLLDAIEADEARDAVRRIMESARDAGAVFEFGPSGVSIRARSPLWAQPLSVAWVFPEGTPVTWMRARDVSLGWAHVDTPHFPEPLRAALQEYSGAARSIGGQDVSSKGVDMRAFSPGEFVVHQQRIAELVANVIRSLARVS